MSFYPLVTDTKPLQELDGWLVSTIHRAITLRLKLFAKHGVTLFVRFSQFPFNVQRKDIVKVFDSERIRKRPLLEVPSFVLVQQAMVRGLSEHGISYVMNRRSNVYSYR
jgi:hypothetical protein